MKLYTINDLKDARIFFDKVPPQYMSICLYFTLILIITSLYLSTIVVKPYIVKAQGVITSENNQYISSNVNGNILEIFVKEGETIHKGKKLFRVSNGQESLQIKALSEQLQYAEHKIEIMNRYQCSLEDKKNYMLNLGVEQEYYGYVEYYLSLLKNNTYALSLKKGELEEKYEKKEQIEKEIKNLSADRNFLEIRNKKMELESINNNIKSLEDEINNPSSQIEIMLYQLTTELGKSRTLLETQITELKSNISAHAKSNDAYIIKSNNTGIIHFFVPLIIGMPVQQNQILAEIGENDTNKLIAEAYILSTDITKVTLNDTVNIAISGVNTIKYGMLLGEVMQIDSGTVTQETDEGSIAYYKVYIRLKSHVLRDRRGNRIDVIKSLPLEARIIYDEETYWDWLLRQVGFIN